jgi:hypothetical protein
MRFIFLVDFDMSATIAGADPEYTVAGSISRYDLDILMIIRSRFDAMELLSGARALLFRQQPR